MRSVLTIAGSDSSAGAGIQADLKTFAAHHVYGSTAITAITAQNTRGVDAVLAIPTDLVAAQIRAVASDLGVHAAKTGMLPTAEIVAVVAATTAEIGLQWLVVDPVMVAKSGARLIDDAAVDVLITTGATDPGAGSLLRRVLRDLGAHWLVDGVMCSPGAQVLLVRLPDGRLLLRAGGQ